jgi:hypothetical protein
MIIRIGTAGGSNIGRWCILIDKHGRICYRWEGELNYGNAGGGAIIANLIEEFLKEADR